MITDPWFYAAAVPAMVILGLGKAGFSSIGVLIIPLMSLAISPIQAVGIVLPVFLLSDIVAVVSYRRSFDGGLLKVMLPGAVVGAGAGWITAAAAGEDFIRILVGALSLLIAWLYWRRRHDMPPPQERSVAKGLFFSAAGSFTSFVTHAGAAPFQMYVGPLRLPPPVFAGTAVYFFAATNLLKVVPYFYLGQFSTANLLTAAVLIPIAVPSTFFGIWLIRRVDTARFYDVIYTLIIIVGVFLIWQGVNGLVPSI
jgi:uncharacterized membrane protein YfcA